MGLTSAESAFLHLLRHALWEEPLDTSYYINEDFRWRDVLELAERQTLLGLLADSIFSLPNEYRPSQKSQLKLLSFHRECIQQNQKVNKILATIAERLECEGITPILVKGQGVAQCYPHPLLRTCGDIDLFADRNLLYKTIKCLSSFTHCEDPDLSQWNEATDKHIDFSLEGTEIELHSLHPEHSMFGAQSDVALQHLFDYWITPLRAVTIEINGRNILMPHPQFNVVYLFVHYFNHLYHVGIGLRQVCDWMMALRYYKGQYDVAQLEHDLRQTGFFHPWQHMATIAVKYLGADPSAMPFALPEMTSAGNMLLRRILQGGNFGIGLKEGNNCHTGHTLVFYKKWLQYSIILRKGFLSDNLEVIRRICQHIYIRQIQKIKNITI